MGENKIPEMKPQLELIKKYSQNGKEYWTSRDLCGAMEHLAESPFQTRFRIFQ